MGCACCCDKDANDQEIEFSENSSNDVTMDVLSKSLKSINGKDGITVEGSGFGRSRCKVDQDICYWEICVLSPGKIGLGMCVESITPEMSYSECFRSSEKYFGIYLEDSKKDDVVSVILNQCRRPNLSFFVNGSLTSSVDRIYCPSPCVAMFQSDGAKLSFRFKPTQFTKYQEADPSGISKSIIPARNIV